MHDGNLSRRAAKADEAEFEPVPEGFGKTHGGRWAGVGGGFGHDGRSAVGALSVTGRVERAGGYFKNFNKIKYLRNIVRAISRRWAAPAKLGGALAYNPRSFLPSPLRLHLPERVARAG
jgi:hypothetical protein